MKKILYPIIVLFLNSSLCFAKQNTLNYAFKYQNKSYSINDLPTFLKQEVYEAQLNLNKTYEKIVEEFIFDDYISKKSETSKKTREDVLKDILASKQVKDDELKKWYEENKNNLGGRDYASIKEQIRFFLGKQSELKSKELVLAKIKKESQFSLDIPKLEAPVFNISTDKYPSKGSEDAKIILVEFADYQCPHCKQASSVVKKIVDKYKNKIKFVYIDFPINQSGVSKTISEGAYCASKQNKYWEYHYQAFEKQNKLNSNSAVEIAKNLKLDLSKFETCFASADTKLRIQSAKELGESLGIRGTPSFFLNGKKVLNFSENTLISEIDSLL